MGIGQAGWLVHALGEFESRCRSSQGRKPSQPTDMKPRRKRSSLEADVLDTALLVANEPGMDGTSPISASLPA